jgi:hypothetical protein
MGAGLFPDAVEGMTPVEDVARLVALALDLDNRSSVAEMHVNCRAGEIY